MNEAIVALTILLISLTGYVFIRGFDLVEDKLLAFSYSYGLGIGLIYTQLFLYSQLGINWNRYVLIIPWVIVDLLILIIRRKNFTLHIPKKIKLKKIEFLLISGILLLIFYTIFEALIRPAVTWDSWATWLMEAKAFFLEGNLSKEIFLYFRSDYPLIVKLHWVYIFNILGRFNDTSILLTSSAFYIFLLLSFYAGNIFAKYPIKIGEQDNVGDIYEKITAQLRINLSGAVKKIHSGFKGYSQKGTPTYCCTRIEADGFIDFSNTTKEIDRLIRATSRPYPGAFTYYKNKRMIVWSATVPSKSKKYVGRIPGRVIEIHPKGVEVLTGDSSIIINDVLYENQEINANEVIKSTKKTLGMNLWELINGDF